VREREEKGPGANRPPIKIQSSSYASTQRAKKNK